MTSAHPATQQRRTLLLAASLILATAGLLELATRGPFLPARSSTLLTGASREEARATGLVLPDEASDVFLKTRQAGSVRATFVRFHLPAKAMDAYRLELAKRPGAHLERNLAPPRTWPDLTRLTRAGLAAPPWWREQEGVADRVVAIVEQRLQPTTSGKVAPEAAEYWVLDDARGRVYLWSWSWPGWAREPAGAPR